MGAAAPCGKTAHSDVGWLRLWSSFLIHQILASWGVIVAAPWILISIGEVGQLLGLRGLIPRVQWLLYGTAYFPAYVFIALCLGWLLSGWLRHRLMSWVWVIPLLVLCVGVARYPQVPTPSYFTSIVVLGSYPWQRFAPVPPGSVGIEAAFSHFFGWGHGIQPYDQVLVVVPFYASAAYSLGALLAHRITRTGPFFERLRRVLVWRLALFVGFPCCLVRGIELWERAGSRLPFYRTAVGIQVFLTGLLIWSAFVTLVFATSVALVGPRFGFTRFFLRRRCE